MHVSFNPNVSFKQSTAFPMMDASRAYFMTLPQTNGAQTAMPVVVVANPELKEEKEEKKGGAEIMKKVLLCKKKHVGKNFFLILT